MQIIFFTFSITLCVCSSAVPMFCCAGQQFYQQAIARGMPAHSLHRHTGEKIQAVHSWKTHFLLLFFAHNKINCAFVILRGHHQYLYGYKLVMMNMFPVSNIKNSRNV
jgi:hypothetical protein